MGDHMRLIDGNIHILMGGKWDEDGCLSFGPIDPEAITDAFVDGVLVQSFWENHEMHKKQAVEHWSKFDGCVVEFRPFTDRLDDYNRK